ncbi:MAG TPA: YidC/Oxa1 family membrane protein insertase [Bacillota bacterium]
MDFFAGLMADILRFFHNNLGTSWGWSIILLTVFIKLLLFPTSLSQIKSMEGMKKITPLLKEIQEKYKNNPEEQQRRLMEVYKQYNVNPFGSCLPMLIQLPFLYALFALLNNPDKFGIDLINEVFLGLNLTQNNYWSLAIISGATTFLQSKLTTPATGQEGSQNTFLYVMPVFLGYITFSLKAGVGIYWVASNLIQIVQQLLITRFFLPKDESNQEDEQVKKRK